MNDHTLNRWGIVVLSLHTLVAVVYSVATPIWEAYDEPSHYAYVKYIANFLQLPPPGDSRTENFIDERKQPPLYYAALGFATFWLQPAEPMSVRRNPDSKSRYPPDEGYNIAIHGADEAFPYHGLSLGVHVARWLTVLIGTVAVGFTFLTARLVFPRRPLLILTATIIHGFAPMALFLSGIVNNDTLAIAVASGILYTSARLLTRTHLRDLLWPMLAIGIGAVAKFNSLTVAPAAGAAVLYALSHHARTLPKARLRPLVLSMLLIGALSVLAGWIYLNDLTSRERIDVPISQILSSFANFLTNPFAPQFGWNVLPNAFEFGFVSFWALFGWSNFPVNSNTYAVLSILCWLCFVGLLIGIVRGYSRAELAYLLLLVVGLLSTIASTAYFAVYSRYFAAFHGRYLMVAMTAISILLATGFANLFPRRWQVTALMGLSLCFILWASVIPFQTIAPAYAHPAPLPEASLAQVPNRMQAVFGDMFELVGYQTELDSAQPGEAFPVTLYWHVLKATPDDYSVAVHVRGLDSRAIDVSSFDSLPSRGNYSTSLWMPGTIVVDRHIVRIARGVSQTTGAQFVVSMYVHPDLPALQVRSEGLPVKSTASIGRFRVLPDSAASPTAPRNPLQYQLGDELALSGYDLATERNSIKLKLYWRVIRKPRADYTTFVHVTVEGKLIAQYDGQPLGGKFPTDLWRPGDVIVDEVDVPIAEPFDGRHVQLWAGMYQTADLQRLATTDQNGQRLPDDLIPIPTE
jgi:Dolichyl-phosphate-mannose-protein mannosyltransferase